MTQSCASCIYGDGERCHWPWRADIEDTSWFATPGPMPEWAGDAIEGKSGRNVYQDICVRCEAFESAAEIHQREHVDRCPETDDMFGGEA